MQERMKPDRHGGFGGDVVFFCHWYEWGGFMHSPSGRAFMRRDRNLADDVGCGGGQREHRR